LNEPGIESGTLDENRESGHAGQRPRKHAGLLRMAAAKQLAGTGHRRQKEPRNARTGGAGRRREVLQKRHDPNADQQCGQHCERRSFVTREHAYLSMITGGSFRLRDRSRRTVVPRVCRDQEQ
jgi:hypothetical protein